MKHNIVVEDNCGIIEKIYVIHKTDNSLLLSVEIDEEIPDVNSYGDSDWSEGFCVSPNDEKRIGMAMVECCKRTDADNIIYVLFSKRDYGFDVLFYETICGKYDLIYDKENSDG